MTALVLAKFVRIAQLAMTTLVLAKLVVVAKSASQARTNPVKANS